MGKWATKKSRYTVTDEIYRKLNAMLQEGKGRSRQEDKKAGVDKNYIYSTKTYETYKAEAKRFARWAQQAHPEVRHLKDLRKYADEYLQQQIDEGKSAWTLSTRKAAIAKTLGVEYTDMIATPSRERKNIVRSRYTAVRDAHISEETEARYAAITASTGLRRRELIKITGDDLWRDPESGKLFLLINKGTKGGKVRKAPLCPATQEQEQELLQLFQSAGRLKICPKLPSAYDNHHHRAEYAKRLYSRLARPVEQIPKEDRYILRKDRKGEILDRKAMLEVSKAMGHNRIDVIAANYLYV